MSNPDVLPEQETLRRRMRAARTLCDITLQDLAARIDPTEKLSERTLRKLEGGESDIHLRQLRPIADALGIPIAWFTIEGPVWEGLESESSPRFQRQLDRLTARLGEIEQLLKIPHHQAPATEAAPERPPRSEPRSPSGTRPPRKR